TNNPWVIWIYDENGDNARLIDARTGRERPQVTLITEPGHRAYGPFAESRCGHIVLFQDHGDSSGAPPDTVVVEASSQRALLRIPTIMNRIEREHSISSSYDEF